MTEARNGNITPEIQAVADYERIDVNKVLRGVANGAIVIPKNVGRDTKACGIGQGLTTKINANIGSSSKIELTFPIKVSPCSCHFHFLFPCSIQT